MAKKFHGEFATVDRAQCARGTEKHALPDGADYSGVLSAKLYFLKPHTYMNASGESIGEAAQFFKIAPAHILVVHDELELPFGFISLKWAGGLGGHNGLRSTKAALGTADFWRLRFGIGRPPHNDIAGYVLAAFTGDERMALSRIFTPGGDFFSLLCRHSRPERLLPEWSKKNLLTVCSGKQDKSS